MRHNLYGSVYFTTSLDIYFISLFQNTILVYLHGQLGMAYFIITFMQLEFSKKNQAFVM